jgi:uncharacterized membrane protein
VNDRGPLSESFAKAAPRRSAIPRLPAIDLLRGFVMVLMAIDHASNDLNGGRFFSDGVLFWKPGTPIPAAQFMTRWITHLCAPTFVLLAGAALAMSVEARRRKGESAGAIDRHIAVRGALIVLFEVAWMSFAMRDPGKFLFQVLYAIGGSLVAMTALRRLGDRALLALGLVIVFGIEAAIGGLIALGLERHFVSSLLFVPGFFFENRLIIAYPLLPWLGIMCLGWVLGRRLVSWEADAERRASVWLTVIGAASLALFVVLRGIDGYGNMRLHRDDLSLLQWLHVSKYPPSATYTTLELGITALLLAGLFRVTERRPDFAAPLRTLGQTALFFYLLHIHVLALGAWLFGVREKLGLGSAYVGAAIVLALLYPLCVRYRRYKTEHPTSLARFV